MRVLLFGATGMIGQGALRECLLDDRVTAVLTVGRTTTGQQHPRLREIARADLFDLEPIESELASYDVCLFCLGVSSVGMSEADYTRITHDLTLSVARTLLRIHPQMIFEYVSGENTDAASRTMWARVKGETENELLGLGFAKAYMLRPGAVMPLHGIRSKTGLYQAVYTLMGPVMPWLHRRFPRHVTTTEELGRAMLRLAAGNSPSRVIRNRELAGL